MAPPVKPRRAYVSPRRREAARQTRAVILDSAEALFVERGYVTTRMDAIAAAAGVAPETVYATFGSKRQILVALLDVRIAGGPDAPAIADQPWVEDLRAAPDARQRLRILARNGAAILARRSAIDAVLDGAAAADPAIAALRERSRAERFAGQQALLRMVLGTSLADSDVADVLFAVGSPEVHRSLTVDRGWSQERFATWYAETLERLLLKNG